MVTLNESSNVESHVGLKFKMNINMKSAHDDVISRSTIFAFMPEHADVELPEASSSSLHNPKLVPESPAGLEWRQRS